MDISLYVALLLCLTSVWTDHKLFSCSETVNLYTPVVQVVHSCFHIMLSSWPLCQANDIRSSLSSKALHSGAKRNVRESVANV